MWIHAAVHALPLEMAPFLLAWDNSFSSVRLSHTANTDCHCKFLQSPAPVEGAVIKVGKEVSVEGAAPLI